MIYKGPPLEQDPEPSPQQPPTVTMSHAVQPPLYHEAALPGTQPLHLLPPSAAYSSHIISPTAEQTEAEIGKAYQAQLFARCARGDHEVTRQFGVFGIFMGAFLFPIGLICTFADSHKKCSRCGIRIEASK